MANVLANMQYVQRQGEIGRQQGQNRLLQGLAPQVVAGDPQAYDRAAAVDPQAAQQLQQAGDVKWARLKGAVDYMKQAQASGNPQGVEAAWQQVRPYFAKISGAEPPATFAEAAPHFGQLEARIAMATAGQPAAASGVQSTFVDEAGNRVAIMRDGSTQVLGRNNASIRVLEQEGQLPYGVVTSGGAAGQVVPLGQGMGAQAPQPQGWQQTGPTMFTAADGQPIPQEDQQALMAAVRQAEATGGEVNVPASTPAQGPLPPRLDYQNGGTVGPVRVPTSAEKAAAEAAARRSVELSTLPAELELRREAALAQAEGEGAITLQNEAASLDATRSRDANKTLNLLAEAERLLPGATGSTSGALADDVAAFFGRSTEGAQKTAALKTIAGQLTSSMPRMQGPQSDKDVQLYKEMAGDLANDRLPVPTRKAALNTIRLLNQKYAGQQAAPESPASSGAPQRARNPQTGEVIELRNGQWVSVQ